VPHPPDPGESPNRNRDFFLFGLSTAPPNSIVSYLWGYDNQFVIPYI
jgi:hypothetical protein